MPGHEGTKCWFASSRERKGSDADASTDAAHKIRAVSAMAIPPPRPRSQDTLAETERAPLPLRRSPLRLMKEDRFSFGAPRCGSTPPGRNCSLGGSVAPSDCRLKHCRQFAWSYGRRGGPQKRQWANRFTPSKLESISTSTRPVGCIRIFATLTRCSTSCAMQVSVFDSS